MLTEWTLREEILSISHRWWLPVIAFLIGSLIGFGVAFLFPTPYRAEANLYVAYNADAIYRNPDDYKNWQLKQLNDLAISDDILQGTLARLVQTDSYWQRVDVSQLRSMLEVAYRNTGRWRLIAETGSPQRSTQLVQAWTDVLLENYQQAMASAATLNVVDKQLQAISQSLAQAQVRQANLQGAHQAIQDWQTRLQSMPDEATLDDLQRWGLLAWASRSAGLDSAWKELLEGIPAEGAQVSDYRPWVARLSQSIDAELALVQNQIADFQAEKAALQEQFEQASIASRGLSATLEVGRLSQDAPSVVPVRPTGLTALVGGVLGLLVWVLLWLVRPLGLARR
jgi:hypothetical protein